MKNRILLVLLSLIGMFLPSCAGTPLIVVQAGHGRPPMMVHPRMIAANHGRIENRWHGSQYGNGSYAAPGHRSSGYSMGNQRHGGYNPYGGGGYSGGYGQTYRPLYNNQGHPLNNYGGANGSRASMLGQTSNSIGFEEWRARSSQNGAHYGTGGYPRQ